MAAVAAVVSAFHGGAELLKLIKNRRARKVRDQGQQEVEENKLENSLVTGEQQINLRYAQDRRELGEFMRVGDGMLQAVLLHQPKLIYWQPSPCTRSALSHCIDYAG